MIRQMAERFSRGIVIKRRLPEAVGGMPVYVSPDAQLKYLRVGADAFDAGLLRLAQEHVSHDAVIWDVGANVGVFTFAAAGLAPEGQVFAIEADPWLAALLRRTSALPEYETRRVTVLSVALSDKNGTAEFVIARRGRASNYLSDAGGWSQAGGVRERIRVPTLTIDTLLEQFPRPKFVKIDVEGAEIMVLRGALRSYCETCGQPSTSRSDAKTPTRSRRFCMRLTTIFMTARNPCWTRSLSPGVRGILWRSRR
jgi:FkbM family methyltransferase